MSWPPPCWQLWGQWSTQMAASLSPKTLNSASGHLLLVFLVPHWSLLALLCLLPFLSTLSIFASLELRLFFLSIPPWVKFINSYGFKNWICSNDVQWWASSLDLPHADNSASPLLPIPFWIVHRHLKFNVYSLFHQLHEHWLSRHYVLATVPNTGDVGRVSQLWLYHWRTL